MSSHADTVQKLGLCAIGLTTISGIVAGLYLPISDAVPLLALSATAWTLAAILLHSWRSAIAGLSALLAAFAGVLEAYVPALLLTIVAVVGLIRLEATPASRAS